MTKPNATGQAAISADTSPETPLLNSYWVLPGQMAAGEHPFGRSPIDAHDRLGRLRDAGIDAFLDLTEADEMPGYRLLLPRRAQYWRRSVPDCAVPEDVTLMQDIQELIKSALEQGRRLYVHCRAGIGRTGTVIGCYLVETGLDGDSALKELNVLWRQSERSLTWPTVPQTREQADYIRRWSELRNIAATLP